MDKADIAALLAVGAAFFIAIGDVIHQRSAHEVTDEPVSHVDLFLRLLRDGRWWLGSVVAAIGFALQAAALGLGSVLLVQALLVTSLLFALPINARLSHRRVTRWVDMGALLARGRGDRDRRQSDRRAFPGVVRDVDGGDRRAQARPRAVRGGRADLVRTRQRGAAGTGVRRAVGRVRGADQGVVDRLDDGLWALLRPEPRLGTGRHCGHRPGGAVVVPGRRPDRRPCQSHDRRRASGRVVLGIVVLGETLRPGDAGWLTLSVAVAVMLLATVALARGEAASATAQPA
jgi:hypothetical protein